MMSDSNPPRPPGQSYIKETFCIITCSVHFKNKRPARCQRREPTPCPVSELLVTFMFTSLSGLVMNQCEQTFRDPAGGSRLSVNKKRTASSSGPLRLPLCVLLPGFDRVRVFSVLPLLLLPPWSCSTAGGGGRLQ